MSSEWESSFWARIESRLEIYLSEEVKILGTTP